MKQPSKIKIIQVSFSLIAIVTLISCSSLSPYKVPILQGNIFEEKDIDFVIQSGFKQIHACNTIPTKDGGLSGREVMPHTIRILNYIKKKHSGITVIAGGGVTELLHAQYYIDAGADHISLGTICFAPWKIKKIINNNTLIKT